MNLSQDLIHNLFILLNYTQFIIKYYFPYPRTGDSRGFAFVRYKYADEAQKAVDRLDGMHFILF